MKLVGHVSSKKILEGFEYAERIFSLGIGIEVHLDFNVLQKLRLKEFFKLKELSEGKPITVHAPYLDLNPGAVDPYVLEATRKRFEETLVSAKVLEPQVVVFHSGYYPWKTDPILEQWKNNAVETFKVISERVRKVAVENVFDRNPKPIALLLENLPENVGACIDTGHLNMFSEVHWKEWISALKGRIFEIHLHNNSGTSDEHKPFFKGSFDAYAFLEEVLKLPELEVINLENKEISDVEVSLKEIRKVLGE